jgi:hypothetical protein
MSHDAFISYSTHDKAAADAACVALEAAGIRCWIAPRDITPGAEWGEAIVQAIQNCRVMILIFSANANDSPQIRREVERAVSKGISIIPLRIQDIAPARSLEYFIGTVHWLDALTPPLEAHLRRLVETVKALLQIDPTPPRLMPSATKAPAAALWKRPAVIVAALLVAVCATGFVSWLVFTPKPQPVASSAVAQPAESPAIAAPAATVVTPPAAAAAPASRIDPALVGTFERDAVINNNDWRFVSTVTVDGTYHLVITVSSSGSFKGQTEDRGHCVFADNQWQLISSITGQTTEGTYQVIDADDINLTGPNGSAVWHRISQ